MRSSHRCCRSVARGGGRAFTLIELLVVISIIVLLVGLLLPALARARQAGKAAVDLNNLRTMEIAHTLYVNDHKGWMVDVGLSHGGEEEDPGAWIHTLEKYYGSELARRSPGDQSPYWPPEEGGTGGFVPESNRYRQTSYGINNYLTSKAPLEPWRKFESIPATAGTVQFLLMTEQGEFAGSDHPHVENWWIGNPDAPPVLASEHLKTHAWGGEPETWEARSNYGFLDGHAEARAFRDVYVDLTHNRFDPEYAR